MRTVDEIVMRASPERCFRFGAEVERWPEWLPHYRWVRFQRKDGFGTGLVEMAAKRWFGPLPWPVWWVSEMTVEERRPAVVYHHVDGITAGMDVEWTFEGRGDGTTLVRIVHEWADGPRWPLPRALRRLVASVVIGPVFVSAVAMRTLAGIKRAAEADAAP